MRDAPGTGSDRTTTTYYIGGVEVLVQNGMQIARRYVAGVALQTVINGVVQATRFMFHDHLGSLIRIANVDGSLAEALDYTAFGDRRAYGNPSGTSGASTYTPRGFTGHEYVDGTQIIHMNGRIYDQQLGRFLQPDPVIQEPTNAQSWNAYTYVFNNPLVYTDPSGNMSLRQALGLVIAIVGMYFFPQGAKLWVQLAYTAAVGFASGYVSSGTLQGGAFGAFTALITFGIGNAANMTGGEQLFARAFTGGVMESLQGGKFGNGFVAAGLTASVMPQLGGIGNDAARTAVGALVGGTISAATGGKFANGAISGAIQGAMTKQARQGVEYLDGDNATPVPDDNETPQSRRAIFDQIVESRERYGIKIPEGYKIEFDDRYMALVDGTPTYCSSSCDDFIQENGNILGQVDRRQTVRTITIFRSGVQPTYVSGIKMVNGTATIWGRMHTTTGYETMVHTLAHEAAHTNGIDINIGGAAYHPNAQRAGDEALRRYRSLFNGVKSVVR